MAGKTCLHDKEKHRNIYRDLSATSDGEPSAQIRQRVQQARRMQDQRFAQTTHVFCNDHHADQNDLHPE